MEPPSEPLRQLLEELCLCSAVELKRCGARVRRLARDLPAFDSVWIDALLQAGLLTSYQARILASRSPEQLRLGHCVLEERLGGGAWSETFVARGIDGGDRRVLKRLVAPSDARKAVGSRLEALVEAGRGWRHPSVVVPSRLEQIGPEWVVASPWVEGPTLRDLLIRRGRFPAEVVDQIGRALLEGLEVLESRGLVHGELGLANVRLTAAGDATAVDAGVRAAIEPGLVIDVGRSPEVYDGTAPERIETGGAATIVTDLYAVGCLLWELLAGRPPFLSGDPLAKLAAHQSRGVRDVRELAPETSRPLAEAIAGLCAADPSDRPANARQALDGWSRPSGRRGRRCLADFVARFRTAAPTRPVETPRGGWGRRGIAVTVASVVVAVLAVAAGLDWFATGGRRAGALLLSLRGGGGDRGEIPSRAPVAAASGNTRPAAAVRAWPEPGPDGVIRLDDRRAWPGTRLSGSRPLVVIAAPGSRPEIEIREGQPLELAGTQVILRGLTFRGPRRGCWLRVVSGRVRIENCQFLGQAASPESGGPAASVAIEFVPPPSTQVPSLELENIVTHQVGTTLRVASRRAEVSSSHCLQVGGRAWLSWPAGTEPPERLGLALSRLTLRRSGSLVTVAGGRVTIEARACVFSLRPGEVLCVGLRHAGTSVDIVGQQCLLTPGVRSGDGPIAVEGLVSAAGRFRGPATADPRDSVLSSLPRGVPRLGGDLPGLLRR